mmetsp:Transcript_61089/g.126103  ORF Transcript_61089/g.126103 Transcript_61089/m.126103 type:complete len:102 (+) Transcript_61089:148-453(+)
MSGGRDPGAVPPHEPPPTGVTEEHWTAGACLLRRICRRAQSEGLQFGGCTEQLILLEYNETWDGEFFDTREWIQQGAEPITLVYAALVSMRLRGWSVAFLN